MFTVRIPRRRSERDQALPLADWASYFNFGGHTYPFGLQFSQPGQKQEVIGRDFGGLVAGAFKSDSVVFTCCMVRQFVFGQARFQYRRKSNGDLWGNENLQILETPWPGGTTADLLARMEQDVTVAGNSFTNRRSATKLFRMRPDWTEIVLGSELAPDSAADDPDVEVIGYVYWPGGKSAGVDPVVMAPNEVAHYAPVPDPEAHFKGMSWLTPVIREVMGDKAMTNHKLMFFENGATPNLVIKAQPEINDDEKMRAYIKLMREHNEGLANAYKTLVIAAGADATAVGVDLQQLEFKATQGAGETRIAAAAGVHPVIAGFSEGLAGASLNAGNFASARRRFADGTMQYLWQQAAGALERIVPTPSDSRLWFDSRAIPFLMDDLADRAKVQQVQAQGMKTLVDGGWEPDSVVKAFVADDMSLLKHSGLPTVQVQQPANGATPSLDSILAPQ